MQHTPAPQCSTRQHPKFNFNVVVSPSLSDASKYHEKLTHKLSLEFLLSFENLLKAWKNTQPAEKLLGKLIYAEFWA